MRIPDRIAELIASARQHEFVTFTTLGREGWPHSRPMDLIAIDVDREVLLFGSVNPGETADNLRRDRRAEVTVARREPREGYTLEGWAEYIEDPRAPEVQLVQALEPARPVVGAFRFHVQRVRVATPLVESTGELLPGSRPRRPPAFRPIDFNVPED